MFAGQGSVLPWTSFWLKKLHHELLWNNIVLVSLLANQWDMTRRSVAGASRTRIKDLPDVVLPTVMWCWVYQNNVFCSVMASPQAKNNGIYNVLFVSTVNKTPLWCQMLVLFTVFCPSKKHCYLEGFVKHARQTYRFLAASHFKHFQFHVQSWDAKQNGVFSRTAMVQIFKKHVFFRPKNPKRNFGECFWATFLCSGHSARLKSWQVKRRFFSLALSPHTTSSNSRKGKTPKGPWTRFFIS